MNTALEEIEVPVDSVQRVVGWLLLLVLSLGLGLGVYCVFFDFKWGVAILFWDKTLFLFAGAVLLVGLLLGVVAVRMALETRKWIIGPNYFERRGDILGFSWSEIQQHEGWHLETFFRDGNTSYILNPIGAYQTKIVPFYRTSDALYALKLGRQLAHATGWPLRLSGELARLEKELHHELP